METKDTYKLTINVHGVDYTVEVDDLKLAILLMNDHSAAEQFVEHNKNSALSYEIEDSQYANNDITEAIQTDESVLSNIKEQKDDVVWTKKRQTRSDLEASAELINLRNKFAFQFDDKTSTKLKLWDKIADQMKMKFNLGEGSLGVKCRQKWSNLCKPVIVYIENQKKTCSGPPFFEEIFSIIGNKYKVNPLYLEDSFKGNESKGNSLKDQQQKTEDAGSEGDIEEQLENDESEEIKNMGNKPSSSSKIENRFKKSKREPLKPHSVSTSLTQLIRGEIQNQKDQFNFFKEHLTKASEQRDRFLNIMERSLLNKRKRESDSE